MAGASAAEVSGTITTAARNKHIANPIRLFILFILFIVSLLCMGPVFAR
jgi:hypothetical protein